MSRVGARLAVALGLVAAAGLVVWLTRHEEPPPDDPIAWHAPDEPWGTIAGHVRDAADRPVADAEVLAQNARGFGGLGRTDREGRYRIVLGPLSEVGAAWPGRRWQAVPVPSWRTPIFVTARKEGFCHAPLLREDIERGQNREIPPLTLWRGGSVRGRVLSQEGTPVVARVRVVALTSGTPRPPGLEGVAPGYSTAWTATNADGTFTLAPVGPGRAELWATASGTGGGSVMCVVREAQQTQVEIRIDLQVHLAGRVVDAEGRGVAGVRVACIREKPPGEGDPDPSARKPERRDPRDPRALEPGDPRAGAGRIRPFGRRPRDGGPPADDSVLERARRRGQFATQTHEDGFFHFYGLRTDQRYRVLIVGAAGFDGAALTGLAPPRGDLELRLPPRHDITGVVCSREGGDPVAGCVVQVLAAQTSRYLVRNLPLDRHLKEDAPHRTAADGRFTIPQRYPGRYELLFLAANHEVQRVPVEVPGRKNEKLAPVDVRLAPACVLVGRVTSSDAAALEGAYVEAVAVRERERPAPGSIQWIGRVRAACDAKGRYALGGLPAGTRLRIRARDARGHTCQHVLELEPEASRSLDFLLDAPARLVVRLEPKGNGARGGFPLRLQGLDDPSVDVEVHSDAQGHVRLRGVMPGRYRVSAVHAKEDRSRESVRARVQEIEIRPGEDVTLPIVVPDVTVVRGVVRVGTEVPRVARVGFGPMQGTQDHFEPLLFDVQDGRFEGRVPPGTYHVNVNLPGRRYELPDPVEVPNEPLFEPVFEVDAPVR